MYTILISHHPALGKAPELVTALRERSEAANAAGSPHAVVVQMYAKEPTYVNAIRHESLGAIEDYNQKNAEDPAFAAAARKIGAALDRAQSFSLHENVVTGQPSAAPNYVRGITFYPALGKGPDLFKALQERVPAAAATAGCLGAGLLREAVPEDGMNFTLQTLHASMAGLEEFAQAAQADKNFQAFQGKIPSLLSGPASQRLYRVLLPFPM